MLVDFTVDVSNIPTDGSLDPLSKSDLTLPFGQVETILENIANAAQAINILAKAGDTDPLAIAGGVLTPTAMFHEITAETGVADDLDTITMGDHKFLFLVAASGHTINLRNTFGNINSFDGADVVLTGNKVVFCIGHDFGTGSQVMVIGHDGNSGGGGGAPTTAPYLTMALDGTLTAERVLTPGSGLALADGGANGNATLSVNQGSGLSTALSTGVLTTGAVRNIIVESEGGLGTADDLIEVTGLVVGETVWLRSRPTDTITVKHNDAGATIKIHLYGNADIVLDDENPLALKYVDTNVLAQVVDQNSGGGTGLYSSVAMLWDEKTTGTAGGSSSTTTWNARDLNTEHYDPDAIVSIASNQFTPIAGDYELHAYAPASKANQHRLRAYNVTGATVVQEGQSVFSTSATTVIPPAILDCKFTANGTDAYRIDHYTGAAQPTTGLGAAANDGSPEIYLVIILRKLN